MRKIYNDEITLVDILLGIILLVVPLIVRFKVVTLSGTITKIWPTENYNYDIFSYYKAKTLIILTLICFALFIFFLYKKE
ncbi:hypothetical protein PL321_05385 [Caloramator sp. mosi_1]|uniref:hypothetical protein n=1 Tax=Caloramator sp. mosi_1 TaxID=3023090 RepID=UPI0023611360|nr:hypothetical protein [Caloramator sp. mosi_1]WDC84982.1 hypothetical protein PL321_05385 [Caloramator sp. mosi_1]